MNTIYPSWLSDFYQDGVGNYNQDYTDKEKSYAGYLMGEFNIGRDLTIVPGVRFQEEKSDISAYHVRVNGSNQNGLDGVPPRLVETKRDYPHWYPSVNIKYKATDYIQLLGAVYRSVSLPSYGEINPLVQLQDNTALVAGNPLLKPSTAWNVDLGASVFSNYIGLFTVDLFYKEITDLIYNMQNYYPFQPFPVIGAPSDIADRLPDRSYYDTTWATNQARRLIKGPIPMYGHKCRGGKDGHKASWAREKTGMNAWAGKAGMKAWGGRTGGVRPDGAFASEQKQPRGIFAARTRITESWHVTNTPSSRGILKAFWGTSLNRPRLARTHPAIGSDSPAIGWYSAFAGTILSVLSILVRGGHGQRPGWEISV